MGLPFCRSHVSGCTMSQKLKPFPCVHLLTLFSCKAVEVEGYSFIVKLVDYSKQVKVKNGPVN